ncbi:MAG: magnesium/cobalt transporter CorA [Lentisphaeraceae bacterium]|nr:magnesium/cobalt transporter CorA [Lentisphaeraceae bacterium]
MSNTENGHVYHKKVGVKPGTMVYTGSFEGEAFSCDLISYDEDSFKLEGLSLESFDGIEEEGKVKWLYFNGLSHLKEFEKVASKFRISPLIQEDILHTRQRAKFERSAENSFIVLPVPRLVGDALVWQQISIIHRDDLIITFSERKSPAFDFVLNRIRTSQGKIRESGLDYLLYALTDSVVDQYLNVTAYMTNEVDDLEMELLNNAGRIPQSFVKDLYSRKKNLLGMQKRVNQIMEAVVALQEYFDSEDELDGAYIIDLIDHVNRIKDNLAHLRSLLNELMNQYLAMNSDHMNEVMKVLTIFSAIFIPLGFIAGLYGMNFDTEKSKLNMPELSLAYGYPLVLTVMVSFVLGLLFYFRKKRWI